MSNTIDFNNVKKAMDHLVNNPKALNQLDTHLQEFRRGIGVDLSDAEFRYVSERLIAQREASAFGVVETASGLRTSASSGLRNVPGGWIIRTEPA